MGGEKQKPWEKIFHSGEKNTNASQLQQQTEEKGQEHILRHLPVIFTFDTANSSLRALTDYIHWD